MWNRTAVTELLGIKYPIIQGPFGGRFSSTRLVSMVSNLGGLGSFGLNSYDAEEILDIDKEIKSLTSHPYVLNLWVPLKKDPADIFNERDFAKVRESFRKYFDETGAPFPEKYEHSKLSFDDQIEAVIQAKPPIASFIFGVPPKELISELKLRGIVVMGTATSLEEALLIEDSGFDLVIASGSEAGGHRASFIGSAEDSLSTTKDLLSAVVGKVRIPVIAAGGITTGIDISEMLRIGADAAQMGTVFLATEESDASAMHKRKLLSKTSFQTALTKVFTGRLARTITTPFIENLNEIENDRLAPYPIQSAILSPLRKLAKEKGLLDFEAFWAGQPSQALKHKTTESLFSSLIKEASASSTFNHDP